MWRVRPHCCCTARTQSHKELTNSNDGSSTPSVVTGMKARTLQDALPSLLSQFTGDLGECLDCLWAVAAAHFGAESLPLFVFGKAPKWPDCLESSTHASRRCLA